MSRKIWYDQICGKDYLLLITISFMQRSTSRVGQISINYSVWTITTGARILRINIWINFLNQLLIYKPDNMSPFIKGLANVDADSFTHGWSVFERFSETVGVKVSEAHRVMWYTSGTLEPIDATRLCQVYSDNVKRPVAPTGYINGCLRWIIVEVAVASHGEFKKSAPSWVFSSTITMGWIPLLRKLP